MSNRTVLGLEELAKTLRTRTPNYGVVIYADGSGHVFNRMSPSGDAAYSFSQPAELWVWLMADWKTRAVMARAQGHK